MPVAVTGRGIQEVDAQVKGAVERGDRFLIISGTICTRHAHAPETHGGYLKVSVSEPSIFHLFS
jgi:hypothetical protein